MVLMMITMTKVYDVAFNFMVTHWELFYFFISSAESQKGVIADQRCSIENQKGAIAIDFVQQ